MNRQTKKVKNLEDYIKLPTIDKQAFINKLGELEDLSEEIGCPLKVRCEVVPNSYIYTFGTSMGNMDIATRRKVITIDKKGFTISYSTVTGREREMTLPWSAYKKTWWLREDKSE